MSLPNFSTDSEQQIVSWLMHQDDLYENDGESDVDDSTYDNIKRRAQLTYPSNVYFTGVGAAVRGGKVKLAFPMNGLTQLYHTDVVANIAAIKGANDVFVESDKLDGTSGQVIYDANGDLQIGYSRGNGVEAADITRHLRLIASLPKKIPATGKTLAIRVENIVPISKWDALLKATTNRPKPYINRRAAAAGIMNSSSNPQDIYQYIDCVAYTIINSDLPKVEQFELLTSYGFKVAKYRTILGKDITGDRLDADVNAVRSASDYDLDGVVVHRNIDPNNSLAFKYKLADATNDVIAVCKDVVYSITKDGNLVPRVNIYPTFICGVTVQYTNGFNAKFINDNKIGHGARLRMTRSGDVSPYILEVVEGSVAKLPDENVFGEWNWDSNKVHAVISDLANNKDATIRRLTSCFTKLKIAGLKKGTITACVEAGFDTFEKIVNMEMLDWYTVVGANGTKIEEDIIAKLTNIYWPELVGSMELGRGVGRTTMTKVYNQLKGDVYHMQDIDKLAQCNDVGYETATMIAHIVPKAILIIHRLAGKCTVRTFDPNAKPAGNKMENHTVVFTGIRSDELEQKIVSQGGKIGSGVTSKTTIVVAKDVNSNSGKVKNARTINAQQRMEQIKIIGINELELMLL